TAWDKPEPSFGASSVVLRAMSSPPVGGPTSGANSRCICFGQAASRGRRGGNSKGKPRSTPEAWARTARAVAQFYPPRSPTACGTGAGAFVGLLRPEGGLAQGRGGSCGEMAGRKHEGIAPFAQFLELS